MIAEAIKSALIKREIWLARREAQARRPKRVARDHCTRCLEHYDNCACDTVASYRARKENPVRDIYLTDEQHLAALVRMRERIAADVEPPHFNDSTTRGDKHTECSWGQCTDDPTFWSRDEQLFPDREPIVRHYLVRGAVVDVGSVSSKYHEKHQLCPFDRREDGSRKPSPNGCFYTCRVFHPSKPMTKERALALYDATIARFRARKETT